MASATIGSLRVELAANIAQLKSDFSEAAGSLKGFTQRHQESFSSLGKAAGIALGAVSALALGVVALGIKGAGIADVAREFSGLSDRMGESADTMLGALRRGVQGTLSDFALMREANKLMGAGFRGSADDMGVLAEGARLLAKRVGIDTLQAMEMLSRAIATGRTRQLAQLGLFVDTRLAVRDYAEGLGVAESKLTDVDRSMAIQVSTLKALKDVIADAGPQAKDFGEHIQAIKIQFSNFTDALSVAISESPAVITAFKHIGDALEGAFGGNQQTLITTLVGIIDKVAIAIVGAAQLGVKGAKVLSDAWFGMKAIFAVIMTGITGALELAAKGIAKLLELAAKIPGGIGDKFQAAADKANDMALQLEGMRKSFQDQTMEALDNADKQDRAFDLLEGALAEMKAEMILASDAADDTEESVQVLADTSGVLSGSMVDVKRDVEASTGALETHKETVLQGVSGFDLLRGAVGNFAAVGQTQFLPTVKSMDDIGVTLGSKTIPTLFESLGKAHEGVQTMEIGVADLRTTSDKLIGKLKEAGGQLSELTTSFFSFTNLAGSAMNAAFGPAGLVTGLFQKGLSFMADVAWSGLKKIGGFFKKIFGGPSAEELAGREIVENFEDNLSSMLTDQQRIESGNESWKKTVIAIRDAYVAQGRSEQEAMADAERLWKSSKKGAEESTRVVEEITQKMGDFGGAMETVADTHIEDQALIKTGNENWKESVLAVNEAYVDQGETTRESLGDAEKLWRSTSDRADDAGRQIDELTRKMKDYGRAARDASRDAANVPGAPKGGAGIPGLAHGGIVMRPTLAMVGEAGPEAVIPLRQMDQAGGGGADLARLERLLLQQPAMMIRAWRDAQMLTGGAL